MAQVEAKTYAVKVSDGQLLEHPFLDKRIVRHKGVISVQVRSINWLSKWIKQI